MKNKALKRLICVQPNILGCCVLLSFMLPFCVLASSVKDTVVNTGFKLKTIIVDPGHGANPKGPGTFSFGTSGFYSLERNVTLAVSKKLQKAIEKEIAGVNAVLTRETEDDVSLQRRAEIANENKGNLFISIHCNALPARTVRERVGTRKGKPVYSTRKIADHSGQGVLMLVYGLKRTAEQQREITHNQVDEDMEGGVDPNDPVTIILTNEYLRKFRQKSIAFANILTTEFVDGDGRKLEGIREQSLYVLCHAAMPSVLIEIGYLDNKEEEDYLNSEEGQNEIVATIIRSIQSYKAQVEQVIK